MAFDTKQKLQDLGAFAFYQGAHGIPLEQTLQEIGTGHEMERANLEQESARREKKLEADVERLERQYSDADSAWASVVRRIGLHAPPVAMAVVVGLLGLTALAVDAILVGPGLDAIGIADPILQFAAAFGLAALSATLFHLAYETLGQHRHSLEIVIVRRGLAGFAVLALLAWGVLRAYQVKFAADVAHNPLGSFLGEHPVIASLFFCFVTLAAPLVGAAAFHDAAPRTNDRLTWTRAKRKREELHAELTSVRKRLEEERLLREREVGRLDAQRRNWEAAAAQYHARGLTNGAQREPHWQVVMKATGWSMAGLVLGSVLGRFLAPLYFILPVGAWMMAYFHYRRSQRHPTYDEFKRRENTRFVAEPERPKTGARHSLELPPPEDLR